ncbi:DUF3040 domain-containing protein [Pseudonocardia bannensis]|uniref:DUF3040 domain-containing protein n=1 Tax=Pseudonocardia bannensis TaxID=630973 RepID=A0A848DFK7_9PSEU|nr:DUF3040 domain-containing protein [Pseudonocardia bannensis]NMH91323.1 DUF3040 domain-containing protein [Pseudonocardia bannensis]
MLSDRERGVLARIEQDLTVSDPDLVRLFGTLGQKRAGRPGPRSMSGAGVMPRVLLIMGLVLLLFGGATAAIPIAGTGIVLTLLALALAYTEASTPRPGPA